MSSESVAPVRIGLVGAGRMAMAIARGLITTGFSQADEVLASDADPAALQRFVQESGARSAASNDAVLAECQVIILAVKPQSMGEVLRQIKQAVRPDHLVVSIAAGVSLNTLEQRLGKDARLVRVMPNTPCLVSCGAAGYSAGGKATAEDVEFVGRLLGTLGYAVALPEYQLDAVTGLSGSGPAYAFQVIEALSDGGVRAGLPREVATKLAAQTLLGAAKMVLESGRHPGQLKDDVASPGGTTIAGLHELERGGVRAALMNAVVAATERSRQLAAPPEHARRGPGRRRER